MSKAVYRALGTILGGAAALVLVSVFPQDRTMLLLGFTLWLGACTFVAALLRDFRSYGAVLCGYTVGIIAVCGIDAPDGALLATLDRVAAILIGIGSVAVVNTLLSGTVGVRRRCWPTCSSAWPRPTRWRWTRWPGPRRTEPLPAQRRRRPSSRCAPRPATRRRRRRAGATAAHGALAAIAGMLGMLSACRALGDRRAPADDETLRVMPDAAAAARRRRAARRRAIRPATPLAAVFARPCGRVGHHASAAAGCGLLDAGGRVPASRCDLRIHYDLIGAA